jgi:hypothetical protein
MASRLPGETSMAFIWRELQIENASARKRVREALRDDDHETTKALRAMGVEYSVRGAGRTAKSFLVKHPLH